MKLKFGSIKTYQFTLLIIFTSINLLESSECSFGLWPFKTVSIDVLTCNADTLSAFSVYNVNVDSIKGNIAYGVTGCPACMGCSCGEAIVGKDSLYRIIDLVKVKENDSIDFSDTKQVKVDSIIDLFIPFAYKNGDTLAVCWVTNYSPPVESGGNPRAGIIHCNSRTDGKSKINFSNIDPGIRVSIYKAKERLRCNDSDYDSYDLLGRPTINQNRIIKSLK